MGKTLGRPKTLDREKVINIAFNEYWESGMFNVSLTSIAKLAKVSRTGIYKEFEDEDGLRTEVLKRYIKLSAEPVHKNYDSYKLYPNHLFNHFDAIINDGNKNLTKDKNYLQIKRPRNAVGCLMERTRLNSELLGPKAKNLIDTFTSFRIECFKRYIKNAQNDGKIKKNLNPKFTAEYILAQFNMIQTYRLNGIKKNRIENILEIALKPILV